MEIFRRLSRPFWAIAILLMAGVGAAHIAEQTTAENCEVHCVSSEPANAPEHSQTSAPHCCHLFPPANLPLTNCAAPAPFPRPSALPGLVDSSVPDAPAREIDYPPQLS